MVVEQLIEKEAAEIAAAEKSGKPAEPWRPDPDDWSLLHELAAYQYDALAQLATLVADLPTAVKTRTKPPPPFSRPETLLDSERRKAAEARDRAADQRLLDLGESAKKRWREQQAG